ncbi:MAG: OmpA family protein [Chitinivibrionales bacterium]|nr:OmpA family protein [Chitinivibrionales bacterium]
MLSYSLRVWRGLSVGANLNIAYQSNFGDPLWGMGLDLGATYRLTDHPLVGKHTFGISTVNLVAPSMSSSLFDFGNDGQYSRDLRLSWLGYFWDERVESGLDIDLKDIWANSDEFTSLEGTADAAKSIEWGAAWRLGGWVRKMFAGYVQLGFGEDALEYWGLAGGGRLAIPKTRLTVSAFYQYNLKTEGDLASSHTIYILTQLRKKDRDEQDEPMKATAEEPPKRVAEPEPLPEPEPEAVPDDLTTLRGIEGLQVEEEEKLVRITARELAIHFESGSAELPRSAMGVLRKISAFLKTYPNHPVTIEGHTDSDRITGSLRSLYRNNAELSEARARNVKQYFVEREGLPASLFTIKGLGDTQPVAPNTTRDGKSRNRRVVITIRKSQGAGHDR